MKKRNYVEDQKTIYRLSATMIFLRPRAVQDEVVTTKLSPTMANSSSNAHVLVELLPPRFFAKSGNIKTSFLIKRGVEKKGDLLPLSF